MATTMETVDNFRNVEELQSFVNAMKVDVLYNVTNYRYSIIRLSTEYDDDGNVCYTWALHKAKYTYPAVLYPMRTTNLVTTFKTLAGVKKNLFNYLSEFHLLRP